VHLIRFAAVRAPAARYLSKFGSGDAGREGSGYMIEMQVPSVQGVEDRWVAQGCRVILRPGRDAQAAPAEYFKGRLNRPGLSGVHWHPKDIGLIMETAEHHPAGDWLYVPRARVRGCMRAVSDAVRPARALPLPWP
jgi:hypothetical protein